MAFNKRLDLLKEKIASINLDGVYITNLTNITVNTISSSYPFHFRNPVKIESTANLLAIAPLGSPLIPSHTIKRSPSSHL